MKVKFATSDTNAYHRIRIHVTSDDKTVWQGEINIGDTITVVIPEAPKEATATFVTLEALLNYLRHNDELKRKELQDALLYTCMHIEELYKRCESNRELAITAYNA